MIIDNNFVLISKSYRMAVQKSNVQCYEPKPNHLTDGNGTNKNKLFVKLVPLYEINNVF